MNMQKWLSAVAAVSLIVGSGVSLAGYQPGDHPVIDEPVTARVQQRVVAFLHDANQGEVQMAQLAETRADRRDIKDFANLLIKDHTAADEQLLALAQELDIRVVKFSPETESERADAIADARAMARLQALTGVEWDRDFLDQMVTGHDRVIRKLERWQTQLQGSQLGSLVDEELPTIISHRDQASELRKTIP